VLKALEVLFFLEETLINHSSRASAVK